MVREIEDVSIREMVEGNYRIIYKIVSDKQINILMIHHGARSIVQRFSKE